MPIREMVSTTRLTIEDLCLTTRRLVVQAGAMVILIRVIKAPRLTWTETHPLTQMPKRI